jgi:cysteine protease ATG4
MAREGKRLGKEVGEWFGPSTAAGAIKKLVEECPEVKLGVVVATDGEIYLNHIRAASRGLARKDNWETPVLILIGVRLGLSGVNPAYYESIKVSYHDQNLLC